MPGMAAMGGMAPGLGGMAGLGAGLAGRSCGLQTEMNWNRLLWILSARLRLNDGKVITSICPPLEATQTPTLGALSGVRSAPGAQNPKTFLVRAGLMNSMASVWKAEDTPGHESSKKERYYEHTPINSPGKRCFWPSFSAFCLKDLVLLALTWALWPFSWPCPMRRLARLVDGLSLVICVLK